MGYPKVVLWVSRHKPMREEVDELKKLYGEDVVIVTVNRRFKAVDELLKIVSETNPVAMVCILPLSFVMHLIEYLGDRVVILMPEMVTITVTRNKRQAMELAKKGARVMVKRLDKYEVKEFRGYKRVKRIVIETEPVGIHENINNINNVNDIHISHTEVV